MFTRQSIVHILCSSAVQKSNGNWAAEEIKTALKQGRLNDDSFTARPDSAHLTVDYLCEAGQVLQQVDTGNISRVCCELGIVLSSVCLSFCLSLSVGGISAALCRLPLVVTVGNVCVCEEGGKR